MIPSAFSFFNIKPKTRFERKGLKDKVAIEKNRISQRVGHAARMQNANMPPTSAGLTSLEPTGASYISNADRFHSDTAGEAYEERQKSIQRMKETTEYRRNKMTEREETRWNEIETKQQTEEQYWHIVREQGLKAKKNKSLVAFDITNLQYHQNIAGEHQKYLDDVVRYRAQARTRNLVLLSDSRAPYNILNGQERYIPPAPKEVQKPGIPVTARDYEQMEGVDHRKLQNEKIHF